MGTADRVEKGFTLIEIMITVAIIGVLSAIAIPMWMHSTNKARGVEAVLQLRKIARSSVEYYAEHKAFPAGTAAVLPGADGGACSQPSKSFAPSPAWIGDPVWSAIDFIVVDPSKYSYHYQVTGPTSAHAWAVIDASCTGAMTTYDVWMEGRKDGSVEWVLDDPLSSVHPPKPVATP